MEPLQDTCPGLLLVFFRAFSFADCNKRKGPVVLTGSRYILKYQLIFFSGFFFFSFFHTYKNSWRFSWKRFNQLHSSKKNPECVFPGSKRSNTFTKFAGRNCWRQEYPKNVFLFLVSRGIFKDLGVCLCLWHSSWCRIRWLVSRLSVWWNGWFGRWDNMEDLFVVSVTCITKPNWLELKSWLYLLPLSYSN